MNFDKIQPHDNDLEASVLGILILESSSFEIVNDILFSDVFYKDSHKLIFSAINNIHAACGSVDLITLASELKRSGNIDLVGGPFYLTVLTNRVGSSSPLLQWSLVLKEYWAKRKLIELSASIHDQAYSQSDVFSLLTTCDNALQSINDSLIHKNDELDYDQQVQRVVDDAMRACESDSHVSGVPTGNHKIDRITGGWQKTDLIILAARPGMGKTTRALGFIQAAVMANKSVAMFSLEMSTTQLIHKQLNALSEVYTMKLRTGNLSTVDKHKITEAASRLRGRKLQIIDRSAVNANFIRTVCRKIRKQQGLDMIVIDYLQLMSPLGKHGSRENEVSSISRSLKAIAKEFNVPLIALSQLSRKSEERPDKRPQLADLRDSGSIEQDADIVIGLYRGSYYYPGNPDKDVPEIIQQLESINCIDKWDNCSSIEFLKHRNGAVGNTILELFEGQFSRFSQMSMGNDDTKLQRLVALPF